MFQISLPLQNPVIIFSLILFIILFSPILLNRISIPPLIGLIIAGIIIGPNGFNFIARDASIDLFGTVGLLYIMFLSSMEMDVAEFKKNSGKSMVFGFYTFIIPMIVGTLASYYLMKFNWLTSILLASMYASNTLITYPIVSKLGIAKNRAVNISVGGTILTTVGALVILAIIIGLSIGEIGPGFWLKLTLSLLISTGIILLIFPIVGRWFFKRYDDNVGQYIFVLGMVFLGAFLTQAGGIEPIVGAFMVGLALNKLIPNTSPLMNRIHFVGNALFIPFFLIGVGMLIDVRIFFSNTQTLLVAVIMTVVATGTKYIAAWLAQKTFRFSVEERGVMFGLTNAQAASTLAAVLVGYNVIVGNDEMGNPVRLLNDSVLNGTIIMILITCTIASFATQRSGQRLAMKEASSEDIPEEDSGERILIPLSNSETVEELIHLSVTVKSAKKTGQLYGLNIIDNSTQNSAAEKRARKLMEIAENVAAATDDTIKPIVRFDSNVVNGILNVIKEHKISDLIIGLHEKKGITDSYLGNLTQGILNKSETTTLIYRPLQPLATIKRHLIFVPDHADKEMGFPFWLVKIWNIGRNTGAKLVFYASPELIGVLQKIQKNHPVDTSFFEFQNWDDFLILSRDIKVDDNLIFIMSRKNYPSYHNLMSNIPVYLNNYFQNNSFILVYPSQPQYSETPGYDPTTSSMYEPLTDSIERIDQLMKTVGKLFKMK
jgi:Kef-type K+ transport system membrane component KefB/nucleotide-binding universal stress UspA family protein